MRQLLLLVVMCAGTSLVARDLFVVVHTTDAVVDRFVRTRGSNTVENGATERTVVRRAGSVDWHAVGGRAPYTVINHARSADGTVCVTVIDADGAVATGCGVMQVQTQVVVIPCAADDATPVPEVHFALLPPGATCAAPRGAELHEHPAPPGPGTPGDPLCHRYRSDRDHGRAT
jgi:hypothetical protein